MWKMIQTEWWKLRRCQILLVGIVALALCPVVQYGTQLIVNPEIRDPNFDFIHLFANVVWGNTQVFLPISLVMIGGWLIDRENTHDTMKNLLTVPVSYPKLLGGKLAVTGLLSLLFGCYSVAVTVLTGVLAVLLVVLLAAGAAARLPQPAAPVFEAPVQRLAGALPARFELAGAECRVTGAQTLGAGYTTGVQPGYELIRVGFERGAGFEWEGSWDDSVYLAVNGGYVEPVDGYELERLYPELAEAALSSYDVDAYGGAEGYFYFLVPQGTREVDICFEQASDAGGERAVQKVLQLTVSLEEGVA